MSGAFPIMASRHIQGLGRCRVYLKKIGEFEVARRDGAYRGVARMAEQPKKGAATRKLDRQNALGADISPIRPRQGRAVLFSIRRGQRNRDINTSL